jgi:plasmid stability protein
VSILEFAMSTKAVRSTFHLQADLHQALRRKAATTHRSMSEIVNEAVHALLRQDEDDFAVFFRSRERKNPELRTGPSEAEGRWRVMNRGSRPPWPNLSTKYFGRRTCPPCESK